MRRSVLTYLRLLLLGLLMAAMPLGAQTRAKLPPEVIEKIEAIISVEMARQSIPGLSIAIVADNKIVYANGFGLADLENSVPAKASTVYRTASIAKPMTATAVMQLAEQGKLALDAPIQEYCPVFPAKRWPVTVRQLLGHLGGVRHYKSAEEATGKKHYFSLVDSLAQFKDDPLLYEPGTKYRYTTYGYSLLGCAIEGASGMSYEDYMRGHVFQPAAMQHTRTDNVFVVIPNRSRGYMKLSEKDYEQLPEAAKGFAKVGTVYNAPLHDTSMKIPGGGLVSTAVDLAKFAIAVNRGLLVKEETREQMWTRQKTRDGQETNYGLGWGVGEYNGVRLISHGGRQAGTRTSLALFPDAGVAIAVMANLQGASLRNIVRQIGEILVPGQPVRAQ